MRFANSRNVIREGRRRGWRSPYCCSRDNGARISFTLDASTFAAANSPSRNTKGRNRKPTRLVLSVLAALQQIIDASPCGDLTYLVTHLGQPYTDDGFGNWFRDRCVEAGVPGRAHGLRKAGSTIAANNGATAHQLMAIFGWRTLKMAEQYTRAADQQRLAEAAMHMLDTREQTRTESCPTQARGGTISEKTEAKSKANFRGGAQERTRTSTPRGAST
jgi:hypothetical protein